MYESKVSPTLRQRSLGSYRLQGLRLLPGHLSYFELSWSVIDARILKHFLKALQVTDNRPKSDDS